MSKSKDEKLWEVLRYLFDLPDHVVSFSFDAKMDAENIVTISYIPFYKNDKDDEDKIDNVDIVWSELFK